MPSTMMMTTTMVTAIHKATATIAAAAVIVGGGGDISFREEILKKINDDRIAAVKRRATKRRAETDLEFFSIVKRFVEMLPLHSGLQDGSNSAPKSHFKRCVNSCHFLWFLPRCTEFIFQHHRFKMQLPSGQPIRAYLRCGVGE